mmetsp:Transcript_11254/g.27673  ORF Transcript_11254/g.27673 Transcript_11254/m.27673 type:complete len:658 (-) Transcript_11254:359-2332(-)
MLRRQREAALRKRQNHVPISHVPMRKLNSGSDGSHTSSHRMSSMATTAMADVLAWEEAKAKERIEARVKEEEFRGAEEVRMRAERTRAAEAEAEAEAARRDELERFEREQLELKRKLAVEQKAREEATKRLEAEARRLAKTKEEAERLEKERLTAEATKRAELERLEEELKQERMERERLAVEKVKEAERAEAERLAERARMMDQQSMERSVDCSCNGSVQSTDIGTGLGRKQLPSQMNQLGTTTTDQQLALTAEETYGQLAHNMAGGTNGYQQYLSTFHQQDEDGTVISELTDVNNGLHGSSSAFQANKNAALHTNNLEMRASKIKRTTSARSLSFTDINEADQLDHNQGSAEEKKESDRLDTHEEKSTPIEEKTSLQQITSVEKIDLDDPNIMRSFLMKPCPKGDGLIQCCIRRNKGFKNALFPEYRIYLKSNNSKTETFLMTSKKRAGNKTSNYLISMSRNDHDKNSDGIIGKLRSNFLGTEYMIYDHGKNPEYDDSYYDEKSDGTIRCELGAILYTATTSLGSKGPRKMKACIGKVGEDGNASKLWQPTNKNDDRMATCLRKSCLLDNLVCLENKPPSWNDEVGAYVLNFNGRVTMASVKNFQLCEKNDEQEQIMQFGRVGKDEFSLDVQWPMSLFQAFAVALSSFDSKLGCD